jgi:hypothetical protein
MTSKLDFTDLSVADLKAFSDFCTLKRKELVEDKEDIDLIPLARNLAYYNTLINTIDKILTIKLREYFPIDEAYA